MLSGSLARRVGQLRREAEAYLAEQRPADPDGRQRARSIFHPEVVQASHYTAILAVLPNIEAMHARRYTAALDDYDLAVIARTIEKAMAELKRDDTGASARSEALGRELAAVQTQLGRLTQAIVPGGELSPLVAELQRLDARRVMLTADLQAVEGLSQATVEGPRLLTMVEESLADCRGLLTRQTTEGRAILRELLVDRVVYAPAAREDGRWCEFTAECSLGRKLSGVLDTNGGGPNGIRTRVSVLKRGHRSNSGDPVGDGLPRLHLEQIEVR